MRVTAAMVRRRMLYNVSTALEVLQTRQSQLASGKRVMRPSDDPVAISKSLNLKGLLRDNEQFTRNIDDGLGWLTTTEAALQDMVSIVTELKEAAVAGANDAMGADEREALAQQVESLIERLIDSANTKYGDRYVFAGTHTLTKPYSGTYSAEETFSFTDDDWLDLGHAGIEPGSVVVSNGLGLVYTEGVDYEIDYADGRIRRLPGGSMATGVGYTVSYDSANITGVRLNVPDTTGLVNREIAQGVREPVNLGGDEILDSGTDVFSVLIDIRDKLYRNDGSGVGAMLDDVEAALDQITTALGKTGAVSKSFALAAARLDTENTNLQALISKLEDADIAELAISLQTKQAAYEAALATAARIMNTTLLNYIR